MPIANKAITRAPDRQMKMMKRTHQAVFRSVFSFENLTLPACHVLGVRVSVALKPGLSFSLVKRT